MNRTTIAAALIAFGAVLAAPSLTAGPAHAAVLPPAPASEPFPDIFKDLAFSAMPTFEFADVSSELGEIGGSLLRNFGKGFGRGFSADASYTKRTLPGGEVVEESRIRVGEHGLTGLEDGKGW